MDWLLLAVGKVPKCNLLQILVQGAKAVKSREGQINPVTPGTQIKMHCGFISCRRGKIPLPLGRGKKQSGLQDPMPVPLEVSYLWGEAGNSQMQLQTGGSLAATGVGVAGMGRSTGENSSIQATESPAPYHEPCSAIPPGEGQECAGHVERHLLPMRSLGYASCYHNEIPLSTS